MCMQLGLQATLASGSGMYVCVWCGVVCWINLRFKIESSTSKSIPQLRGI